jgi:hypothetical protein
VSIRIEALSRKHARTGFLCGESALDKWFEVQAGQGGRRNIASALVALDGDGIVGFYSLSMFTLALEDYRQGSAGSFQTIRRFRPRSSVVWRGTNGLGAGVSENFSLRTPYQGCSTLPRQLPPTPLSLMRRMTARFASTSRSDSWCFQAGRTAYSCYVMSPAKHLPNSFSRVWS